MLTDWRYYEAYNDVYRTYFSPPYPARSTIESGLARQGALIEVDAIAVAGARHNAVAVTTPEMT
jgi:2-iminobutanoate/2-iminopropanoate deaminase